MQADPGVAALGVGGIEQASHIPEMLAGMQQINDLNRAGEVLLGDVPDPLGTIADDDLFLGATPAAFPGLQIEALAELLSVFDGTSVSCGVGVANGKTLLIRKRLRIPWGPMGWWVARRDEATRRGD